MSAISVPAGILSLLLAASILPAQQIAPTAPAPGSPGLSKVRIVRLSDVRGSVQVEQSASRGFEPAMENLPIVETDRIRTGLGIAEVEFEDNSTLRVTPNSEVEFPELERTAAGAAVTEVRVVRGLAYVSLMKKPNGYFTLEFGPGNNLEKIALPPASHIRLQVDGGRAQLAVLGGGLQVNGPNGPETISHRRTVSYTFAEMGDPAVTKRVAKDSFDAWDRQSMEAHERVASLSAFGNAPYAYGVNDLAYYGAFSDMGGCGMMWRPYFADAAWDPYSNGMWAWYQGAGYSWVSPYPWGWMPYHYGSWSYCSGQGWGWMPGGGWNGLNNTPAAIQQPTGGGTTLPRVPHPPIRPPLKGRSTMIAVNRRPLVASGINKKGAFVFRRGSAGLGVPREGLGKLRGFSRSAMRRGFARTPVYLSVDAGSPGMRRGMQGTLAPVAIHRGFAPAAEMGPRMGFAQNSMEGGPIMQGAGMPRPMSSMSSAGPSMGGGASRGAGGGPRAAGGAGGHSR